MNIQKIVCVHLLNNYTGSPLVLKDAIGALKQAGMPVDLYTSKGPGFLDDAPARKYPHWYRWSPNKYRRLLHFMFSQLWLFVRLLRYWKQPVLIYVNTILPFGAALAGWLMGKPVLYHIHETAFEPPAFTRFLLNIISLTASRLLFVSRYLQAYHHFAHIPSCVVYNALPEAFTARALQTSSKRDSQQAFHVLMVCSLKKAKGIFEFIEIGRQLPQMVFSLVISQSEQHIARFLGSTSVPANVHIYPMQQDLHAFYAEADLLLSLSHPVEWPETFGMTILEGMYYGLPCIVPPVGAPLEIVREGVEGFHLDMREPVAIAEKIRWLAGQPEVMAGLSARARKRAQDFSMAAFRRQLQAAVLQGLCIPTPGASPTKA